MSKRNGSSNTASSRLAEMYHITTLSPSAICGRGARSLRGGATEVIHGRRPAQDLLDRAGRARCRGRRAASRTASGCSISARMPCDGGVARGLVARHREQQHEHVELELGQLLAVDLGVDELGDDVVAGVARVVARSLAYAYSAADASCAPSAAPSNSGSSAPIMRVRPLEDQAAVLLRHAHDLGDRLQRQLRREVDDEVALAAAR